MEVDGIARKFPFGDVDVHRICGTTGSVARARLPSKNACPPSRFGLQNLIHLGGLNRFEI